MIINRQRYVQFALAVLVSLLFSTSAFANVTLVSVVQNPENPVVVGNNVSYTVTVSNPVSEPTTFIDITVLSGVNITPNFRNTSANCMLDGIYNCGELTPGSTAVYSFEWVSPPAIADYPLTFQIGCSGAGCIGGSVDLTTSVVLFSMLPGLTTSEKSLANVLDTACASLDEMGESITTQQQALLDACSAINAGTSSEQVSAIRELLPKQAPAQGTSSIEASTKQFDNVSSRMTALRSGVQGVSTLGLTLHYQGLTLPGTLFAPLVVNATETTHGGGNALFSRLGFFINGNISLGEKDASSSELAFDFNTKGLTVGVDYRFSDQFILGGALGYVRNDTDFQDSRGSMSVNGHTLSFYSTYYHSEAIYLDAIASIGLNRFDNSRKMSFSSFSGEASGDTTGTEYSLSVGGGYDYYKDAFSFGPYGRINYIQADIDSYTEESAVGLALNYEGQSVTSLNSQVGGRASYAISTSRGVFVPHVSFEWAHEFNNDSRHINATFVNDPTATTFKLSTDDPDRDYFKLGTGITSTLGGGKTAYLYYETLLGQDDVTQHTISAGGRFEF
ncbi:MAG: autotransporter outer membrane beta-barrel domain-containing protein [Candidatus Polarisedimenticolaceae bacterium]|nr:autotransporter outer membrane beta-barrel domain-containing protein [Candidatus Polarisedimenticolaceae bacterium]